MPLYADDETYARLLEGFRYCFERVPGSGYPPIVVRREIYAGKQYAIDGAGGPVSFLPVDPECAKTWTVDPVLIPMTIVPGKGSLTVTWPRQYNSNYRITAVPQPLVTGNQPAYKWQDVAAGAGCTVTATIKGLRSGTPYVVWLDAPNTGYMRDGTRHPYSGESGVVYPS